MQFKPLIILKINIDYSLFKYFADLVSFSSNSIEFHIFGNKMFFLHCILYIKPIQFIIHLFFLNFYFCWDLLVFD